jgi:hypothetical protein
MHNGVEKKKIENLHSQLRDTCRASRHREHTCNDMVADSGTVPYAGIFSFFETDHIWLWSLFSEAMREDLLNLSSSGSWMIYEMSARYIGAHSLQLWLTFRRSEIKHEHILEIFSKICHLRSIYLF